VGLTNLGSESETCVGNCAHLVGVPISFEKNFYRLPFTPPLSGSPYRSFNPKIRIRSLNTGEEYTQTFKSEAQMTQEETKNPLKTAHASKVLNPFARALAPPFIGRRRDFYILKMPSNLWNIHSVNVYMNVLYIPYIYKPATSSHIKHRLLRRCHRLGFL
jgi:hypothetical protein